MQVKIFRAANLQAALEEIREELGPNASVLRTRQCREGWMGWLGRTYVEVTASVEDQKGSNSRIVFSDRVSTSGSTPRGTGVAAESRLGRERIDSLRTGGLIDQQDPFRANLLALGVTPEVADRWLRSTRGFLSNLGDRFEPSLMEHLQRTVCNEIRINGPIALTPGERRVVALVGPTGVGKTTTVAKLAAGFRMQSKRRVGLLTIDTFRIAAVQQLQAYAQIMDLPMSVVESTDQMRAAIDRLGDVDLILIDTAGRSPKGDMDIAALAELLQSAQPDETHLVISATSTAAVVRSVVDGFAPARPTAAVLTKLDETPYTAGVLSAITPSSDFAGIPVSYITHGQHVPDDIALATARRLTERLLPNPVTMPQIEVA